jgi:VIT1/CCC1 family predicted Fe2+/Mn2+ transporter
MPQTPHVEKHFTGGAIVRDIVIGMSDGLTVPFALTAGLSGAVDASSIVITAGIAEMAAGSIAMGLGGYLAAKSDVEHYESERAKEKKEIEEEPVEEAREVFEIAQKFGLEDKEIAPVVSALRKKPEAWLEVLMKLELGLERPDPKRAPISALTIGGAYVAGGLIPLLPYFFVARTQTALIFSVVATMIALVLFGAFKGRFTGAPMIRSGLQTLLIGGIAAGAAFFIARLIA